MAGSKWSRSFFCELQVQPAPAPCGLPVEPAPGPRINSLSLILESTVMKSIHILPQRPRLGHGTLCIRRDAKAGNGKPTFSCPG
jgi:hypothetical protein